jgi:hypothetical protein
MSRIFMLTGMALLFAMLLPAADVTGTWKGSLDANGRSTPVTLELKSVESGLVTGVVQGFPTPDSDVRDGRIDGNNLSFFINIDYEGEAARLVFKGTVSGNEIDLDMRMDTGGWGAHLTLKKS